MKHTLMLGLFLAVIGFSWKSLKDSDKLTRKSRS
jgi:hypothetical protein